MMPADVDEEAGLRIKHRSASTYAFIVNQHAAKRPG
jgi:hypothetical protein